METLKKFNFDGFIFDSPYIMYTVKLGTSLSSFMENISNQIREEGKYFFTTLLWNFRTVEGFEAYLPQLFKISDKILLCMYDYSGSQFGH